MPLFSFDGPGDGLGTLYVQAGDAASMQAQIQRVLDNSNAQFLAEINGAGAGAGRDFVVGITTTNQAGGADPGFEQPAFPVGEVLVRVVRTSSPENLGQQVARAYVELSNLGGFQKIIATVPLGSSDAQTYMVVIAAHISQS